MLTDTSDLAVINSNVISTGNMLLYRTFGIMRIDGDGWEFMENL